MKTKLFKIAHAIKSNFKSFADALTYAWKVIKLQIKLKTCDYVNFTFKKVDGSIRDAVGTLKNAPAPKYLTATPTIRLAVLVVKTL